MPAYKQQHFLPLAYLGQFGGPPERELRKRRIWRVSDTHAGEVPVGTQCQEDYFYSKHRAALCESYFSQIESIYGSLMGKIARRESLSRHDLFLLFLCAVDFYARGSRFRAHSAREEYELYLHRIGIFKTQLISSDLANADDAARRDYILRNWDFGLIPFLEETAVLTSDSPSIWFGSKHAPGQLQGVLMPVTPLCCFVAAHRPSYCIEEKVATPEDAHVVSINEIENSVDAVFFSDPLSGEEIAAIRGKLASRLVVPADPHGWRLELIDYDENPNLTFLKIA